MQRDLPWEASDCLLLRWWFGNSCPPALHGSFLGVRPCCGWESQSRFGKFERDCELATGGAGEAFHLCCPRIASSKRMRFFSSKFPSARSNDKLAFIQSERAATSVERACAR